MFFEKANTLSSSKRVGSSFKISMIQIDFSRNLKCSQDLNVNSPYCHTFLFIKSNRFSDVSKTSNLIPGFPVLENAKTKTDKFQEFPGFPGAKKFLFLDEY